MKTIIAIDPGASGGIAVREYNGSTKAINMPETYQDIYNTLYGICKQNIGDDLDFDFVCYLEDVGKGIPGQSSKATASFARHCGHLEMALYALQIPIEKILPSRWQKTLGIGKGSDCADKREWKNKLKCKAQELYPQIKVTLKNADALLMLHYAIEKEK